MLICTRVVAALLRSIHSVILCFRFEDFIYLSLAVFSSAASLLVDSPHFMPSHSCCFNRVLFSAELYLPVFDVDVGGFRVASTNMFVA